MQKIYLGYECYEHFKYGYSLPTLLMFEIFKNDSELVVDIEDLEE